MYQLVSSFKLFSPKVLKSGNIFQEIPSGMSSWFTFLVTTHYTTVWPRKFKTVNPREQHHSSVISVTYWGGRRSKLFSNMRLHTWDGGSKKLWIFKQKHVLQSPPPHTLGTNHDQSFPLKRRDLGYLLIQQYLMSVKLWEEEKKF